MKKGNGSEPADPGAPFCSLGRRMRSRLSVTLAMTVLGSAACSWWGCSSSSSGDHVTCGPGTELSGNSCVIAKDGGIRDGKADGEAGEASLVPTFRACGGPRAGVHDVAPGRVAAGDRGRRPPRPCVTKCSPRESKAGIDYTKPAATTVAGDVLLPGGARRDDDVLRRRPRARSRGEQRLERRREVRRAGRRHDTAHLCRCHGRDLAGRAPHSDMVGGDGR